MWDLATRRFRKIWSRPYATGSGAWPSHRMAILWHSPPKFGKVDLRDLSTSQEMIPVPIPGQSIQIDGVLGVQVETSNRVRRGKGDGIIAVLDSGRRELLDRRPVHSKAGNSTARSRPMARDWPRWTRPDGDAPGRRERPPPRASPSVRLRALDPGQMSPFSPDGNISRSRASTPMPDPSLGHPRGSPDNSRRDKSSTQVRFLPYIDSILVHNLRRE